MKTKIRTRNQNRCRYISEKLRLAAKMLWSKLESKGRTFEPFPNEAPH